MTDVNKLREDSTTLAAKMYLDMQNGFKAEFPMAIVAHYDIEIQKLIDSNVEAAVREARLNENSLFWKEALDIYHGMPIDNKAWWYTYHMERIAQLQDTKGEEV